MLKLRYISAPRSWSHKEYSCSAYPAHSVFTFDEFWGILGLSIFRNSSSVANNTQSRLSSRIPFLMTMVLLNVMFLQSQGNHKFITIFAISPKNTCKGIHFYLSCSRYINCTLCKNKLLYWYIQGLCYNFRHIYFSQYLSMSESSLLHFF